MKTSEVLEKAQAILMNDGWVQGSFCNDGFCAAEAIREAIRRSLGTTIPGQREARNALCDANGIERESIVFFNDRPATTFGDVLQAFDAGIAYAKAQEGE